MDMPYEDLQRDFVNCIVMYKNKPVYIQSITKAFVVLFTDLMTQEQGKANFTLKAFSSPSRRLGFINIGTSCIFVTRIPVRKYYMGISSRNIQVAAIDAEYAIPANALAAMVTTLCLKEIGSSLLNVYPTLKDAANKVKEFGGSCAFDKQFAISAKGTIFYRELKVGSVRITANTKVSSIVWSNGKEHLNLLLEKNHEKDLSDFRYPA